MTSGLIQLWTEESGQGMTEYSLVIALVAMVLIGALIAYGDRISRIINYSTGKLAF